MSRVDRAPLLRPHLSRSRRTIPGTLRAGVAALALSLLTVDGVHARVERLAIACEGGMCLWERPVIQATSGWVIDTESSARVRTLIYLRAEKSGSPSQVRVVAQAFPRNAGGTLDDFVIAERDRLVGPSLDIQVNPARPLREANGRLLATFELAPRPGREGSVQTVAVAQDGEYFVTLTYTADTRRSHGEHLEAFAQLVRGYRPEVQPLKTKR